MLKAMETFLQVGAKGATAKPIAEPNVIRTKETAAAMKAPAHTPGHWI
jgi:hypothetical protein